MHDDPPPAGNVASLHLGWITRGIDWLIARERCILITGMVFQVVFLIAMMIGPLLTLATGQTILLRVVPFDPRDLFRGDYVNLSYDINRPGWDANRPANENWANATRLELKPGQTVYVLLEPEADGKHWHYSRHQLERPTEGIFIRGTAQGPSSIHYGIEQYFVQEGTGHVYEKAVREKKLSAEIVLDRNGSAQIKRLVIE
jgi:uncharacterized membrane-anchored protein